MTTSVRLPLLTSVGETLGEIEIRALRSTAAWRGVDTILDLRDSDTTTVAAPVQLLEEVSYDYDVVSTGDVLNVASLEPSELFSSSDSLTRGRLSVGRSTGTVQIRVEFSAGKVGYAEVEVRSRKLDYESEYRYMLLRIAQESAELVQHAFAASALRGFDPDVENDAESLYQRFAFLQALLDSEDFDDAVHLVYRRPHFEHRDVREEVNPGRSLKAGAGLIKQLSAAGDRQRTMTPIAGLDTVPRTVQRITNETTFDTVPNRFVKYALSRWRSTATDVVRALSAERKNAESAAVRRGIREARSVAERLEEVLAAPVFDDVGRLASTPTSNQVLQGRAGYRTILEHHVLAESAATVRWDDSSRVFGAGQKNVAELYEYWVFLELARIVESLPGLVASRRGLVHKTPDGMSLQLRRGRESVVTAVGTVRGTRVRVRLWFNKRFDYVEGFKKAGSWTVRLQPDCSIQIEPLGEWLVPDTWLHFDAKYRIQQADEVVSSGDEEVEPLASSSDAPLPADLAKMHAYRDAIRRTSGAYVLYPGGDDAEPLQYPEFHEVLPGLGAFALRPTVNGEASESTASSLRQFIADVVDHVASQGTSDERKRYWTQQAYGTTDVARYDREPVLQKPPADTSVLLGFVRSERHLDWILRTGLYNVRADAGRRGAVGIDADELAPDFVLLYDAGGTTATLLRASGPVVVLSAEQMAESGYPDPGGRRYFGLTVEVPGLVRPDLAERARSLARSGRARPAWSKPRLVTWSDVLKGRAVTGPT